MRTRILVALLALTFLAPLALASQDAPPQVWTGKSHGPNPKVNDVSPAGIRKTLAQAQMTIDVDRDLEKAHQMLDRLCLVATHPANGDDRLSLLVDIAVARAGVLEKLGHNREALQAATSVFFSGSVPTELQGFELRALTKEEQALDARAVADLRLAAFRERLSKSAPAPQSDAVDKMVFENLPSHPEAIIELGRRAAPALETLLLATPDEFPALQVDPLVLLLKVDEPRGASFIVANFDRGGELWKRRIHRAMAEARVVSAPGAWLFSQDGDTPPTLANPLWIPVIARMLRDPGSARDALNFASWLVTYDAVAPEIQRELRKTLLSDDVALAQATMTTLQRGPSRATVQPVLDAGLDSPEAIIRARAVEALLNYQTNPGLVGAMENKDPLVRKAIASSLRSRTAPRAVYHGAIGSVGTQNFALNPTVGERERAALAKLTQDENADVRLETAAAISELNSPLPLDVYMRIARDPDPRVRARALYSDDAQDENVARIAELLAQDSDAGVVRSVDYLLSNLAEQQSTSKLPDAWLAVLERRRANSNHPLDRFVDSNDRSNLYSKAVMTRAGLKRTAEWAVADGGTDLVVSVAYRIKSLVVPKNAPSGPRRVLSAAEAGVDVDPQVLAQLYERAFAFNAETFGALHEALIRLSDDFSAAFLPIADDARRPRLLRVRALDLSSPGESSLDRIVKLLADPSWTKAPLTTLEVDALSNLGAGLSEDTAAKALTRVAADRTIVDDVGLAFAYGPARRVAMNDAIADAILARWFTTRSQHVEPVCRALRQIATRPREKQGDWLVRAVRNPMFTHEALMAIGDTRDPSYLPVLRDALRGDSISGEKEYAQTLAVDALARYLDDSAAQIILEMAGSAADPSMRDYCFAALAAIRKFQDERGRWEARKTSQQAKDDAVRALVPMLDDTTATVRAEAARSIATLGAVDQLPRIVKLLKDADSSVRAAAQQALDVLNGTTSAKKE